MSFLEPLEGEATFEIQGELRVPREGRVGVPLLRLPAAERETGGVAVEVLGSGEVRGREARGLGDADPTDLGPSIARRASPLLVAFRYEPRPGSAPRALAVDVIRYTPQTTLTTHVEEARYRVLLTEEGKTLVQALYGVRNNQSTFLTVALPATATLWTASAAGRPVRPGRSPEGALLLPLEKARPGEEPPAFAVEVVYVDRGAAWGKDGEVRLTLPVLGQPVARTGLLVHHSPRYRIELQPGSFRASVYLAPSSEALAGSRREIVADGLAAAVPGGRVQKPKDESGAASGEDLMRLVERFQQGGRGARAAGVLPVQVPFPDFGPAVFLASELTAEGQTPAVDLRYRRLKR